MMPRELGESAEDNKEWGTNAIELNAKLFTHSEG